MRKLSPVPTYIVDSRKSQGHLQSFSVWLGESMPQDVPGSRLLRHRGVSTPSALRPPGVSRDMIDPDRSTHSLHSYLT
jgi:hypothetical protein